MASRNDRHDAALALLRAVLERQEAFRKKTLKLRLARYLNLTFGYAMSTALFLEGVMFGGHPVAPRLCGFAVALGVVSFVVHLMLRGAITDAARSLGGRIRPSVIDVEFVISPSDVQPEK